MTLNIFVFGPAGSGKTTFVKNFSKYIETLGYSIENINLDPGTENADYSMIFDIRNVIELKQVMKKFSLGPNGAMIKSMEILIEKINEIKTLLEKTKPDFRLIDTPGQMEIFAFREIGPLIAEKLQPSMGIFLIDGEFIHKIQDFVVFYTLSLATEIRMGIPIIKVINKKDLIKISEVDKLLTDVQTLKDALEKEKGVLTDVSKELLNVLEKIIPASRIPVINSLKKEGFDEVFDLVYEIKCTCGDLT